MPIYQTRGYITIGILLSTLFISSLWYALHPTVAAEKQGEIPAETSPLYTEDHVIVNLRTMTVELRTSTTTLASMPIINVGKPGSYYETIGGAYENDYTIKNHFSSIGHVYMPWSVHVFGNFFIHGIPYYENGTKVASEYSGGCIRLSDEDAQRVYDFVQKGTPILVTENKESDFAPTKITSKTIESIDMTRIMAAVVSLEVLTQDTAIFDPSTKSYTTRRKLLPRLIVDRDTSVIATLAHDRGAETFLMYMNTKAKALGLTNTHFASLDTSAVTTNEDMERFLNYIVTYKTYLQTLGTSTQPVASQ